MRPEGTPDTAITHDPSAPAARTDDARLRREIARTCQKMPGILREIWEQAAEQAKEVDERHGARLEAAALADLFPETTEALATARKTLDEARAARDAEKNVDKGAIQAALYALERQRVAGDEFWEGARKQLRAAVGKSLSECEKAYQGAWHAVRRKALEAAHGALMADKGGFRGAIKALLGGLPSLTRSMSQGDREEAAAYLSTQLRLEEAECLWHASPYADPEAADIESGERLAKRCLGARHLADVLKGISREVAALVPPAAGKGGMEIIRGMPGSPLSSQIVLQNRRRSTTQAGNGKAA